MNTLLTPEIKAIIQACLFESQTVKFHEARNSFSIIAKTGFVHTSQFIPLFKTNVRTYFNTVSIDENGLDAHFCLYEEKI
ncbi:hypothetical protein [Larkinella punicea]|uniref:Uncharacterized protein n=1 Tax=Larkinella punicea TaxID=2315727 RepID=A0A368JTC4_9BACT|nr:hypothetical protein [Larkinella punicea]RCR69441.1 hypothetical protein DUE52_11350 [Larkinella punicea]